MADEDGRSELEKVVRWRAETLERLGLHPEDAADAAELLDLDLHEVDKLVRAGCDPKRAVEILV